MNNDLGAHPCQMDFKTNDTPPHEVMSWIMDNSTRVEHLLDKKPRLSRWWFDSIDTCIQAILKIQELSPETEYRLICLELDALVIQHGDF